MYFIFTKPGCSWCDKAKQLMIDHGFHFVEIDINASIANLASLKSLYPEVKTVPQIFGPYKDDYSNSTPPDNTKRIGGYSELVSYLQDRG